MQPRGYIYVKKKKKDIHIIL